MNRCPHVLDCEAASRYPRGFHGSDGRNLRWHAAAPPLSASFSRPLNGRSWNRGNARPSPRPGWPSAVSSSGCAPRAWPSRRWLGARAWDGGSSANGASAGSTGALQGGLIRLAAVARRSFPPAGAVHLVTMACERPDNLNRSPSQGDGLELARQLAREGVVESISPDTVRRLLSPHARQPWRHPRWLLPHLPRGAECSAPVADMVALSTRPAQAGCPTRVAHA